MSSTIELPTPTKQRAIITNLLSHETGSHVYAVSKSWYRKWQLYTDGSTDTDLVTESRAKVAQRSNDNSPQSTEEQEELDLLLRGRSLEVMGSSEVTRDSDGHKSTKAHGRKNKELEGVEKHDSLNGAGPGNMDSGSPGPLTMDREGEGGGNMWIDEAVWKHWVSWYGVSPHHQLDRRNWASEEKQYEVCVLSPYAGIVSNPLKMLDNNETAGWVELQLRHMFQVSEHTPTRLWACEKQRSARFSPLLDRSRELCFLLHPDRHYILALELCNRDNSWPTRVPGEPGGDFKQYARLITPPSRTHEAWESELSTAVETVFQGIHSELQDTVSGVVSTASCLTQTRQREVEQARCRLTDRMAEVDRAKACLEEKSQQLVKQQDVVRAEASVLSQERAALDTERNQLAKEMLAMEALNRRAESKVRLDVGGTVYTTSTLTLTRDPSSMLAAMFSGRHQLSCEGDGTYFIDRDGTYFRYILNFLRDGGFRPGTLPTDPTMLSEILAEAEYYQISGLVKLLTASSAGSHDLCAAQADHVTPEKLESPGRRVLRKIVQKK